MKPAPIKGPKSVEKRLHPNLKCFNLITNWETQIMDPTKWETQQNSNLTQRNQTQRTQLAKCWGRQLRRSTVKLHGATRPLFISWKNHPNDLSFDLVSKADWSPVFNQQFDKHKRGCVILNTGEDKGWLWIGTTSLRNYKVLSKNMACWFPNIVLSKEGGQKKPF